MHVFVSVEPVSDLFIYWIINFFQASSSCYVFIERYFSVFELPFFAPYRVKIRNFDDNFHYFVIKVKLLYFNHFLPSLSLDFLSRFLLNRVYSVSVMKDPLYHFCSDGLLVLLAMVVKFFPYDFLHCFPPRILQLSLPECFIVIEI